MLHIKFKYKDKYSNWKWREQECFCSSLDECKVFYGLNGIGVYYKILSIEEME